MDIDRGAEGRVKCGMGWGGIGGIGDNVVIGGDVVIEIVIVICAY